MAEGLREDPRTGINWRTHPRGCQNYRERWLMGTDLKEGEPLYQVFCLMNTPPVTQEEQNKCLASRHGCWRLARHQAANHATSTPETPTPSSPTA